MHKVTLYDSKERNVRDSPYISNYQGKSSKRKHKEDRSSKENLSKVSKKKSGTLKSNISILKLIGNSKRSKQEMIGVITGKHLGKNIVLKNNSSNTLSKKIKVKSVSQNNRKKIKKNNLNNTFKEADLIDTIMKMANPSKKSHSKMHQTIGFYGKDANIMKYSNRDYLNQSNNSRSSKKKGLTYMKQMMNKTVLIQNQDYQVLNNPHYETLGMNMSKQLDHEFVVNHTIEHHI
jgi:hypothetical protein